MTLPPWFVDAYGMDAAQRVAVVDVAVRRAANASLTMRAAADVDPVFARWWEEGVKDHMPRAEQWVAQNADDLRQRLLQ